MNICRFKRALSLSSMLMMVKFYDKQKPPRCVFHRSLMRDEIREGNSFQNFIFIHTYNEERRQVFYDKHVMRLKIFKLWKIHNFFSVNGKIVSPWWVWIKKTLFTYRLLLMIRVINWLSNQLYWEGGLTYRRCQRKKSSFVKYLFIFICPHIYIYTWMWSHHLGGDSQKISR